MSDKPELPDENSELFEHFRFVADEGQRVLRIDKYLMSRIENATRNKIQNAAKAGNIFVNGQIVKQNYKVKPDDIITIMMTHPPREIEIIPEDIPLNIVYEDNDIIVVNKKAGMVVHPAYGNYTGTLINALTYYLNKSKSGSTAEILPYLAHRIDKDTSGLLLIAKNELAQSRLAKEFFNHTIERKYVALVWGDFTEEEGTVTGHIGRSLKNRKVMTVFPNGEYGKNAITHYKVIERFNYVSMIECQLETGRTHQIRAHLKYIGHPLFNDETYGGNNIIKGTTFSKYKQFVNNCFKVIPRQALHAKSLGFKHPVTNKQIHFDSNLPQDMNSVIEKWRNYSIHSKDLL